MSRHTHTFFLTQFHWIATTEKAEKTAIYFLIYWTCGIRPTVRTPAATLSLLQHRERCNNSHIPVIPWWRPCIYIYSAAAFPPAGIDGWQSDLHFLNLTCCQQPRTKPQPNHGGASRASSCKFSPSEVKSPIRLTFFFFFFLARFKVQRFKFGLIYDIYMGKSLTYCP